MVWRNLFARNFNSKGVIMTINKIASLSLIASALLSTSAFAAGTLTLDSNASVMASELVIGQDYNGTSVDLNASYRPALTAGINSGKLLITYSGARIASQQGVVLVNATQGKIVGNNPQLSGSNSQKLTFDINDSINDYDQLYLSNDTNGSGGDNNLTTPDEHVTAVLDVLNGSSNVTSTYELLDNVDNSLDKSPAKTVITLEKEWSASVVTKFDGQIDAAQSFSKFVTTPTTNPDLARINIKKNANVVVGLPAVVNVTTTMENNISAFGALTETGPDFANPSIVAATSGYKYDINSSALTATSDHNLSFTDAANVVGTNKMLETTFTTTVTFVSSTSNPSLTSQTLLSASASNLGAWTTYGYKGNIPGASYKSGTTDTKVTVVNNQTTATADMIIDITDATGNTCSLVSGTDTEVAKPAANSSTKYTLSTMLGNSKCSALTGTLYHIGLTLPTTPTKVFAQAAVVRKDSTSGIAKVLPVYNNGTSY